MATSAVLIAALLLMIVAVAILLYSLMVTAKRADEAIERLFSAPSVSYSPLPPPEGERKRMLLKSRLVGHTRDHPTGR